MSLRNSVLLGLGAALTVYGTITVLGRNSFTWMLQFYAYIVVAVGVWLQTREGGLKNIFTGLSDRFLYVVDREERKVRKVLTGEEFRIRDTEKVQ